MARLLWGLLFIVNGVLGDFVSMPPIPSDKTTPVHQRVAFRGPTSMAVAWNTFQQIGTPTVHYGLIPDALISSASSNSSVTFSTSRTWANTVVLTGLLPYTQYYYQIDSTNSTVLSFTTARTPGDMTPFVAAAVIDMGLFGKDGVTLPPSKRHLIPRVEPGLEHTTIGALENMSSEYDFIIHPGDFAYADDWIVADPLYAFDQANAYESITERFFLQLQPISGIKAYMVGPGNHEATCVEIEYYPCASGQKNFSSFINRFGLVMPTVTSIDSLTSAAAQARANAAKLANPPFWYSFDYGMTHFVMIDTETDLGNGIKGPDEPGGSAGLGSGPFGGPNQQISFLQQDLASVDRAVTPWLVVGGHRPWYTAGDTRCDECQDAFEPLFNQYGVDLAVFGHVHNMQEIAPIANNVTDPAGLNNPSAPWYIINGAAGNIEGLSSLGSLPSYVTWGNDTEYGFSKLVFEDTNHLTVQFIRSSDGSILRTSTLYKAHTTRFVGLL